MKGMLTGRGTALATNIEYVDNGDIRPGWLSADGTIVYSWGPSLKISKDDGHTWTTTNCPVQAASHVHGIRETADGELLVSQFKAQGFYAGLWRSTGWNRTTGQATSWTEVLTPSGQAPNVADPATFPTPAGTTGDRSNYFTSWFGFRTYGNGVVIVNEYGKQANGTTIPGARYVFISTDNGKPGTWALARDFWGGPPYTTAGNVLPFGSATNRDHMHGACYDPFTGRVWFTGGDSGHHTEWAASVAAAVADPYNASAAWTLTSGSAPLYGTPGGQPGTTQCVAPYATSERILLGSDGPIDGVQSYEKAGAQKDVTLALYGIGLPHTSQLQYTAATTYQRDSLSLSATYQGSYPILVPFYVGAGGSVSVPGRILAFDPLARRCYPIWTDTVTALNPYGVFTAIGPTANGKLLASIALDGRSAGQSATAGYTMLRADFPVIT